MDFDEFEKQQEEKQAAGPMDKPIRYGSGCSGSACGPTDEHGLHRQMQDWEDYMQYGFMGFVPPRDYHGF